MSELEITACRFCGALITFQRTKAGKLAPYDVEYDEEETPLQGGSHFGTCSQASTWSRRSQATAARKAEAQ